MNYEFFTRQMARLVEAFGKKSFNQEKSRLLLREFNGFSEQRFTQMVDELILEQRYAPTVKEFRDKAAQIRENVHEAQKGQMRTRENAFTQEQFSKGFTKLHDALGTNVNLADFNDKLTSFLAANAKCKVCLDEGIARTEKHEEYLDYTYKFDWRCTCSEGQALDVGWPTINKYKLPDGHAIIAPF